MENNICERQGICSDPLSVDFSVTLFSVIKMQTWNDLYLIPLHFVYSGIYSFVCIHIFAYIYEYMHLYVYVCKCAHI